MDLLLILILVAAAFIFTEKNRNRSKTDFSISSSYRRAGPLFTPAERSFLGVLDTIISKDYRIFGKVRIADVIQPRAGLSPSMRKTALNKVSGKHFDFVICRASDLEVVCVLELNDSSHLALQAQASDLFKKQICTAMNVPLVSFPAQGGYVIPSIKSKLATEGKLVISDHQ